MMGTLPGKADWFATMERAGVPMFNDVEEMAEAAGLLARYPALRDFARDRPLPFCDHSDSSSSLNQKIVRVQPISVNSRGVAFLQLFMDLWIFRGHYRSEARQEGVGHRPGRVGEFAD